MFLLKWPVCMHDFWLHCCFNHLYVLHLSLSPSFSRSLRTALWVSCAVLCSPPGGACRGTSVPAERESTREERMRTAVYNTGPSDRNHAAEEKVTALKKKRERVFFFCFFFCLKAPPCCFNWLMQRKRTDCNLYHALPAHQSAADIGRSRKTAA